MATTEPALAPKPQSSEPCSGGCVTLGLENVVGFTQKLWKDVSHKPFLGCARWRPRGCVRGGPDCGRQLLLTQGWPGRAGSALRAAPRAGSGQAARARPRGPESSRRLRAASKCRYTFSPFCKTNADALSGAAT